jgi:uncharacterized protein YqhQ
MGEPLIGGQAVIEGVMMRAPRSLAVAVRRPDGGVAILREPLRLLSDRWRLLRLPVVRGTPALLQSLTHGMRALRFSAAQAVSEAEVPNSIGMLLASAVAIGSGIGLFFLLPLALTQGIARLAPELGTGFSFNLVDGLLRFGIFLVYLSLIALWSEIRRVFEYHGAEHMVVSAYEHGDPLTVAGARAHSTRHPRCGTNFLLVVVAVSVFVFSFIPGPWGFIAKFLSRLALLPVVAGIAFEIMRLGGRPRTSWLAVPGYWLQALTTRPPSDDQIEVALRALREVLDMEGGVRGVHQTG